MPSMDETGWQHLFNIVAGALFSIGLWFWRMTHSDVKQLARDLEAHKLNVATNYVTNAQLLERLNEIKSTLNRMDEKLDEMRAVR